MQDQFTDRVRFNWGYHDAAQDVRRGWKRADGLTVFDIAEKHFDKPYARGFVEGWEDQTAGTYLGLSDAAWKRVNA